ncbi:MAG TPA: hypothetical protein VF375_01360 [Candidatus Limnocylindrales bacterium]
MTTPSLPPRPTYGSSFRPIEDSDLTGYGSAFDFDDEGLDYDDYELGWGDRFRNFIGRGLARLGWLALAAALALGSAGIVAAADHSPSTGSRPELTWSQDQILSARLTAATRDLARLGDDVDSLFNQGMNTLSGLTQINQVALQKAWDEGWNNVNAIDAGAADLNSRLQCAQWDSSLRTDLMKTYRPALVDRYLEVCQAIAAVAPLHDNWQSMFDGSRTAIVVVNDIEDWDAAAKDARNSAAQGNYADAIAKLRTAADSIADASRTASLLAVTTDVGTLTKWLTRMGQLDDALALLWQMMIDSHGVVTSQVAAALRAVNEANAMLPQTTDDFAAALQVAMYEMAGNLVSETSDMNQAKGALANALADLTGGGLVYGK